MAWLFTTQVPGGSFGNTGKFIVSTPNATSPTFTTRTLPSGINAVKQRPSFAPNNDGGTSRLYAVGGWTDNLVFTENFTLARQGIPAPINPILNAAGSGIAVGLRASGTGVTGVCIGYITWWDDLNKRRSALSGPSPSISLTNQGRLWDNLPTDGGGDPTVTHIELWVSMDGNSPHFVARRDLGTTSVTEAVATLALGEAFGDTWTRFPRCRFNTMFHNRQVMSGDDQFPDRIYLSLLDEPEKYGGLFLRTLKGERVVGLYVVRDMLLVGCATCTYLIQGYTEEDFEVTILEPSIGLISHWAVALVHGLAIVPSQIGWYLCTGSSMHPISKDFQLTWRQEYATNQTAYQDAWAVNDLETNTYILYTGNSATQINNPQSLVPGTVVPAGVTPYIKWVIDYTDLIQETGGTFATPRLSIDVRGRAEDSAAILSEPGASRGYLYSGSCDGYVRRENVADGSTAGDNDDSDAMLRTWFLLTGCYFFGDAGGTELDAAKFAKVWTYAECERSVYTVNLYIGDERQSAAAWSLPVGIPGNVPPSFTRDVPAGLQQGSVGGNQVTSVPKTVDAATVNKSGRGIAMAILAVSPAFDNLSLRSPVWKGFGGLRMPGATHRGAASIESER